MQQNARVTTSGAPRHTVIGMVVALVGALLLGLLSTLPVYAAFPYRMVVKNSSGAPLYLFAAPWDDNYGQSSCIDLDKLGIQQMIPVGQSVTLVFNRSGLCDGEQGWLSLRASHNPASTSNDFQQFWFDNDGGLSKYGLMATYQNQLSGGANGVYRLDIATASDRGHDYPRYGYKMAVTNASGKVLWMTAARDDQEHYGALRSSCITPNPNNALPAEYQLGFGHPHLVQIGETRNFYFRRSDECEGEQGWLSLLAAPNQTSISSDFQQVWFDNEGGLEKQGRTAAWPNALTALGIGHYALNVTGAAIEEDLSTFSMVFLSDPQLPWWRGGQDPGVTTDDTVEEQAKRTNRNLVAAVNKMETLGTWPTDGLTINQGGPTVKPRAAVINGDLTAYFHQKEFDLYRDTYSYLSIPRYEGLGNHDYQNNVGSCSGDAWAGDNNRCAKEAFWYMASHVAGLRNLVSADIPRFVAVYAGGWYDISMNVSYKDEFGVEQSTSSGRYSLLKWRTQVIPPGATDVVVRIDYNTGCVWEWLCGAEWEHLKTFYPVGLAGACYQSTGTLFQGSRDAESRLCEGTAFPDDTEGSLGYSFEIGDYHFIQLHNYPGYSVYLPGQRTAHQVFSFGLDRSPSVKVTPSFAWLKQDVANATVAGKNIIINFHDLYEVKDMVHLGLNAPEFRDAVRGANVVTIFGGHIHQQVGKISTYSTSDGTKGRSDIPVIQSGSAECETLVYADFHEGYFNWSVVSSKDGTPTWENDRGWVCDERKNVSGRVLFTVDVGFAATLDSAVLSSQLRSAFEDQGITLHPQAQVVRRTQGSWWEIYDPEAKKYKYRILNDQQALDVYDSSIYAYNAPYNNEMLGTYIFAPQIAPKAVNCLGDFYEPNNEISASVPITPGTFSNLSICGVDTDYFAVALNAGDTLNVDLTFANSAGNLEMEVLDPAGQVVGQATSTTDNETLSPVAAATGGYRINVFGAAGAANPTYDLGVDVIAPCPLDSLEPNNAANFSDAAPLAVGATTGLTICRNDPVDTYAVALRKDTTVEVTVNFTHADGDLEVAWYNFDGKLIKAYRSSADGETFTFDVPVDASYYLQVYASGNVANSYDINIAVTIPWKLFFNWSEQSFREGIEEASIQYVVRAPSNQQVTVNVVSADGTADGVADYQAFNTTTTESVGPNATVGWIDIPIVDDTLVEADETFTITLTIGDMSDETVITIVDNDFSDCMLVTAIPADQCQALVDLFAGADDGADGATWSKSAMWLTHRVPCYWDGVTCENGVVTRLELPENNISGPLPASFIALSDLQRLDLSGNQLRGPLPDLSTMTQLESVNLANNQLTGPIPASLEDSMVAILWLENNNFSGSIPEGIGRISTLEEFHVNGNPLLRGAIPATFDGKAIRRFNYAGTHVCRPEAMTMTGTVDGTALICEQNSPPVASAQSITVTAGAQMTITLSGTDAGADPLTYRIVNEPAHGTLSGDTSTLLYRANRDFVGMDSFTFVADDGVDDSNLATVTIHVTAAPNTPPIAHAQTVSTTPATAKAITLTGADADANSTLTYALVTAPANGTLSGSAPNVIYTPNGGFTGSDSFTFTVSDGIDDSAPATVTILVDANANANQSPLAANDSVNGAPGVAVTIAVLANDSDPDGDALTVTLLTLPANGTATVSGGQIIYTPNAGFSGTDSFTYRVSDGKGGTATATVTVTVSEEASNPMQQIYLPLVNR